jgi:hypothetical protein
MEHVDVVELEPLIVDIAKAWRRSIRMCQQPKVRLTIGDAREWLLLTPERYDIIASEPSNPFRAGVASLFTREYYKAADARLTEDGLFLQWVQAYEVDARTIRTVYATMASVFPNIETWQTTSGDMVLVGGRHPITYRSAALGRRIRRAVQDALRRGIRRTAWLFAHYVGGNERARRVIPTRSQHRRPQRRRVRLARAVDGRGADGAANPRRGRQPAPASRRRRTDADPSMLRTAFRFYAATGFGANITHDGTPVERASEAIDAFYAAPTQVVRENWQQQTDGPRDPVELAMLAMLEVYRAQMSRCYIDRIRGYEPAEADAIHAMLLVRKENRTRPRRRSSRRLLMDDPWPLQLAENGRSCWRDS